MDSPDGLDPIKRFIQSGRCDALFTRSFATVSHFLRKDSRKTKGAKMNNNYKQLTRSKSNRMIAGICAGLGEYLGIDPTIVRLLFVLGFFMGLHGGIVLIYLIMAIVTPEENTAIQ
jgi:phage shock protein PspC (stress-responsive transcriptional regulator)